MPISFVGVSGATTVASGNITLTEPAGVAQGDLLVACIAFRDSASFTLPSGWTIVGSQQNSGNTSTTASSSIASGLMAYIIRGSSAPALTFNRTGGNVALGRIAAYRGVDQSNPLDTGVAATSGSNTATPIAGTITPAGYGRLLVMAACMADNVAASGYQGATAPETGRWFERADSNTATGADTGLAIASAFKDTAASTGDLTCAITAVSRHVLIVGAFKPADGQDMNVHALVDFLQTVTTGNPLSVTTPSVTPADNSLFVVAFMGENDGGALNTGWSVSDSNGLTWTQRKAQHDGNGSGSYNSECEIWTAPVTTGAAGTITVARSGINSGADPGRINVQVLCVEGADTASPIGASASGNSLDGTTGAMTLSASPAATSVTLAARAILQSGTDDTFATPGSGWLECIDQARSAGYGDLETQIRENSTSTSVSWTDVNDSNIGVNTGSPFGVAVEILVGAATIDADGDLDAQASTMSGDISVIIEATGDLDSQAATLSGDILTSLDLAGDLVAQVSTLDGSIDVIVDVVGDLDSQSSTLDGSLSVIIEAIGDIVASVATLSGSVEVIVSFDGALAAQTSQLDGSVNIGDTLSLIGDLAAQAALLDAAISVEVDAIGTLTAQQSNLSGEISVVDLPRREKPMHVHVQHNRRPPGGFNTVFYVDDK